MMIVQVIVILRVLLRNAKKKQYPTITVAAPYLFQMSGVSDVGINSVTLWETIRSHSGGRSECMFSGS